MDQVQINSTDVFRNELIVLDLQLRKKVVHSEKINLRITKEKGGNGSPSIKGVGCLGK